MLESAPCFGRGSRRLRSEIPEYPFRQSLIIDQLGEAVVTRFATLPLGLLASSAIKANVARINRHFDASIALTGDQSDMDPIDTLADGKRLPGGSLVAAAAAGAQPAAPDAYARPLRVRRRPSAEPCVWWCR